MTASLGSLLLLLALVVRLPLLTQSLWYDEVWRTRVVLSGERAWEILTRDVHAPLYNAFMALWIRLAGDSELSIRIPSLLAGLGTIALVHAWCRRRLGIGAARRIAAWLLVTPFLVWWSTQAKNTAFTLFFTTWALIAVDTLVRERTGRAVLLGAAAGALAIWTDLQSLLALIPAWGVGGVVMLRHGHSGHRLSRVGPLVLSATGTLLLSAPLLILKATQIEHLTRDYLGYLGPLQILRLLAVHLTTGEALALTKPWKLAALLVLTPAAGLSLAWGVRSLRRAHAAWMPLAALAGPVLLLWVVSEALVTSGSQVRVYQPRNLVVILPWFAVLLLAGDGMRARVVAWLWVVLAAGSSVLMITLRRDAVTVDVPNPAWREFARFVNESPGTRQRVGVVSPTPLLPLRYYAPALDSDVIPPGVDPNREALRLLNERGWDQVWVVSADHWLPIAPHEAEAHGPIARWRGLRAWRHDRTGLDADY
ncbi:MAG: glycosyltransferase family 39 protein [Phycisphaerales bacterium]|nr:glycosyltransferase family 39 protein [Phycisphaerales bacterium]